MVVSFGSSGDSLTTISYPVMEPYDIAGGNHEMVALTTLSENSCRSTITAGITEGGLEVVSTKQ